MTTTFKIVQKVVTEYDGHIGVSFTERLREHEGQYPDIILAYEALLFLRSESIKNKLGPGDRETKKSMGMWITTEYGDFLILPIF